MYSNVRLLFGVTFLIVRVVLWTPFYWDFITLAMMLLRSCEAGSTKVILALFNLSSLVLTMLQYFWSAVERQYGCVRESPPRGFPTKGGVCNGYVSTWRTQVCNKGMQPVPRRHPLVQGAPTHTRFLFVIRCVTAMSNKGM